MKKILIIYPYLTQNVIDILKEFDKQAGDYLIMAILPLKSTKLIYSEPNKLPSFKNLVLKRAHFINLGFNLNPFLNPFIFFLYLLKFKPSIVIVLDEAISINTFFAAIFSKFFKFKTIFYAFENINKIRRFSILKKIIFQIIKKTVNYGVVCTEEAAKILNEVNWYPKVKVIWWGVNTELFGKEIDEQEKILIKNNLGISKNQKVIAYVGRFIEEKGIKDLVEAFKLINNEAVLIFIGDGPLESYLNKIKENLKEKLIILKPYKTEDLVKLYQIFDVLVLPSKTTPRWKEQYGRVLIEAMAAGVSVVGSNSGAIPVVIGNVGSIFSEGNIKDLAKAIDYELTNRTETKIKLLKERAQNGSINNFVKNFLEFIKDIE